MCLRKPGICFHYYCAVYDECKYSDTIWFADRTLLFVQYTISLSSLNKLIWRHWTYKTPVRYILSSVWVRLSTFSPLSIIQYVGLYVFSLPISLVMIERIHILCLIIIIKSEVWTITHCSGLGHETMVSAVCLFIFLEVSMQCFRHKMSWKDTKECYIYIYIYICVCVCQLSNDAYTLHKILWWKVQVCDNVFHVNSLYHASSLIRHIVWDWRDSR